MNILASNNFQLIKRDVRELKSYLFGVNNINEWNKIIVVYNIYLFYSHIQLLYTVMNYITSKQEFLFKETFLFFYLLCNLKNIYLYFIINISKIDKILANKFYNNTKDYFI